MTKRLARWFAMACLIPLAITAASAADISGQWTAAIDTMIGQLNWSFNFKLDGATLTGTATFEGSEVKLENGKVEGDAISFVENREMEGMGSMQFTYTGKIISASEIQFHRTVGTMAEEDFTAKRAE